MPSFKNRLCCWQGGSYEELSITSSCELTDMELETLEKSTRMTREQIQAFHKSFLADCPSGVITRSKFVKMYENLHSISRDEDDKSANGGRKNSDFKRKKKRIKKICDYIFRAYDVDAKNAINFIDFINYYAIASHGSDKEKAEFAFKLYDLNKDNKITKKELLKVIHALYDLAEISKKEQRRDSTLSPQLIVEDIMQIADRDNDKVLKHDEFVDACLTNENVHKTLIKLLFN